MNTLSIIVRGFAVLIAVTPLAMFAANEDPNSTIKDLTSNLPTTDRIEIESVSLNGENIDKVLATKTLTRGKTQELENLWRSQNYAYDVSINCHTPAYRIRFYKTTKLLTEATICFHCQNIYFYKYPGANNSEDHLEATFGCINSEPVNDDSEGKNLRTYLAQLFPGHDPEANKP